jgi:UDP-N-acetylmuramoyl-L-alanyl-D-glutamate--2,6-diaminopimelate ligase
MSGMTLGHLLDSASVGIKKCEPVSWRELTILGVTNNSSQVLPGYLFVATPGATKASRHGHEYVHDALKRGAGALVVGPEFSGLEEISLPVFISEDPKHDLALLSEAFFGHPSKKLQLIGITGTNGKTSTSFMLHSILKAAGFNPKVLGTLGFGDPGSLTSLGHTTPEAPQISQILSRFEALGVTHVAMEISSHALELKRVDGLKFAAIGVTNLSQDHLDFHVTLDNYRKAKAKLFTRIADENTVKVSPINNPLDLKNLDGVTLFGPNAENSLIDVVCGLKNSSAILQTRQGKRAISVPFLGRYQLENAELAATIAQALGIGLDDIVNGLKNCPPIPGRGELLTAEKPDAPTVLVDYAHTPEALKRLLSEMRKLKPDNLMVVFGCGGDRDAHKRPLMGAIAAELADIVVVTDDNPRFEDPAAIRRAILSGTMQGGEAQVLEVGDRKRAIHQMIKSAGPRDIVIIAGKGHETLQIYGNEQCNFSDQLVAWEALASI